MLALLKKNQSFFDDVFYSRHKYEDFWSDTSLGVDKLSRNLDRLNMTMDTTFFSVSSPEPFTFVSLVCILCSSLGRYFLCDSFLDKAIFSL